MDNLLIALATLVVSTLTGTVGVGGALLVVPLLMVTADHFFLVTPEIRFMGYLMNFISLMPVVRKNWPKIDLTLARPLLISSVLGGFIGARLTGILSEQVLLYAFVACLGLVMLLLLRRLRETARPMPDLQMGGRELAIIGGVGFVVGLASGMFGIGGGVLMLPLIIMFLGVKPTPIILLTPLTVLFSTGTGIGVTLWQGLPPLNWEMAAIVVAAAMVGASLGNQLREHLSDRKLLWVVVVILGVLLVKMGLRAAEM